MEAAEVVIVGGGPAGSTCAWALRRSGIECVVLDKAQFPRNKLCAGWITPEVVDDLEIDVATYPHRFLTFEQLHFHFPVVGFKTNSRQHSIRRFEFDAWLLERSGVEVRHHEVRSIRREGQYYIIDDEFRCANLVGAAGTRCPVYRTLFRGSDPRVKELQAVTLEEEFPYQYQDDACHLWFFNKGLPGYSWYVPKADGYLNVGIGGMATKLKRSQDDIKPHWREFTRRLGEVGLVTDYEFKPSGYSYFIRGETECSRIGNAYIVGDAAGLATRDLCEGIGPAVKSGLMAAASIIEGKDYNLTEIARYSISSFLAKRLFEFKLHNS